MLSVTFIDKKNCRTWTYDNIIKIEQKKDAVLIQCKDGFRTLVYFSEFSEIRIELEENIYGMEMPD